MKRFHSMLVTMLISGVLLTGGLALSSEGMKEKEFIPAKLSMEEAITTAKTKFPGQALEAELENEDGQAVYEIEIASTTGTATEIKIDAQSGEILDSESKNDDDHKQQKSEAEDHD